MGLPSAKGAAVFVVGVVLAMIAVNQVRKYLAKSGKDIPGLS